MDIIYPYIWMYGHLYEQYYWYCKSRVFEKLRYFIEGIHKKTFISFCDSGVCMELGSVKHSLGLAPSGLVC